MVFVWSYPADGDPAYILVRDYVNGKACLLSNLVQGWSITDTVGITIGGQFLRTGTNGELTGTLLLTPAARATPELGSFT